MLYRYTLTVDVDEDTPKSSIETLRGLMENGASFLSETHNITIEDENAIHNNKKMLYKPIVNTIDVKYDPEKPVSTSLKYLLAFVKQIEHDGLSNSDFHNVLITAINTMIVCNRDKPHEDENGE